MLHKGVATYFFPTPQRPLIADDDLKAAPPPKRSCVLSWKGSMASAAE